MPKLFIKYWLPVWLYAVLIFILSSISGSSLPQELILSDYLLHILEYLPFGFLMCRAVKNTKIVFSAPKIILFSFILVFLYSMSDELHQFFVPERSVSLVDLISDNLGALIGMKFAL